MRFAVVLSLVACGSTPAKPVASNLSLQSMQITDRGVGTLTERTRATLTGLRAVLPGYDVTPQASQALTVFNVNSKGEKLMSVIASDDGSMFSIQVTSAKIASATHDWKVGGKLVAGVIDACECATDDDSTEIAVCYKTGEHVAVVFVRPCIGLLDDEQARKTLVGVPISRLAWQPRPWAPNPDAGMGM